MGIRYAESFRCSVRAGWSVFGLQQLHHDTLVQGARIDDTLAHIDSCMQTLREMHAQSEPGSRCAMSLWLYLRQLQARKDIELRRREVLRKRWQFSIPMAMKNMLASIEYGDYREFIEEHTPKWLFLSTLVIAGEVSQDEFMLATLGENYFSVEASLPELTVTLRIGTDEEPSAFRDIPATPNPHYLRR